MTLRNVCLSAAAVLLLGAGILIGANKFGRPQTVLHIVTVRFKPDTSAEQRQAVIDGVATMAGKVKGIKNVWLKTLKVQGENYNNAFVIEFENEAAFKAYDNDPAHREWEKSYLPVRDRSTTHDVTN